MICDIRTANNRTGDYQKCESEATHISRFGWFNCEEHRSPADLYVWDDQQQDELIRRLEIRQDFTPEMRRDLLMMHAMFRLTDQSKPGLSMGTSLRDQLG